MQVAIKNFKKADVRNEVEHRAIEREIRILKLHAHSNIVRLCVAHVRLFDRSHIRLIELNS